MDESASTTVELPASRTGRWLVRTVPFVLGVIAFGLVLLTSQTIFPYLSNNHDEGVYLFHARMLEQGKLWMEPPAHGEFFNAWFIVNDGHKVYPKYSPVFPALLTAADIMFKDMRVALALIGAGVVVAFYFVGLELYRRPVALLGGIFLMFSPLFLVQASIFLAYMLSFLFNLFFLLFFLKAIRNKGWTYPLLAGACIGLGAFARPYSALLFALPVAAYAGYLLAQKRMSVRTAALLVAGAVPFLAVTLGYNSLMTGNPLLFGYNAYEPADKLGFGIRRFAPGLPDIVYTPVDALHGIIVRLESLPFWVFGGPLLVVLAAIALKRRRLRAQEILLAGIAGAVVLGSALYWGNNPVSTRELLDDMGPFYYVDLLLPLCLLGARGFFDAVRLLHRPWRRGHRAASEASQSGAPPLTTAVMLALVLPLAAANAYLLWRALDVNFRYTIKHAAIYSPFVNGRLESALVFLPTPYGPFIHHPFGYLLNDPSFNGPVVYARNLGNENLELMKTMPERRTYVYQYQGKFSERAEDVAPVSLLRIQPVEGRFLSVDMEAANTTNRPFVWAYIWNGERTLTYLLDDQSGSGKTYRFRWYVAADRLYFDGPNKGRADATIQGLSGKTTLNVAVAFSSTRERKQQEIFEYRYWFAEKDGMLTLGAPGEPWRNTAWPDDAWLPTDISSMLRAGVSVVPGF